MILINNAAFNFVECEGLNEIAVYLAIRGSKSWQLNYLHNLHYYVTEGN